MITPEKFTEFVQFAGEVFDYEDFIELDVDPEDIYADELGYSSADIVRDETNEVFRFCIFNRPLNLALDLSLCFDLYRDLENEDDEDEYDGAVLLVKSMEDEDFWYVYRTESGEIGVFHSDLSNDDEEDDEDDAENEEEDEVNDADDSELRA